MNNKTTTNKLCLTIVLLLVSFGLGAQVALPLQDITVELGVTTTKDTKVALLTKNSAILADPSGDTFSLAILAQDAGSAFFISDGSVSTHTFDNLGESAGNNLTGTVGGTYEMLESYIGGGGVSGSDRILVQVTALDSGGTPEPWIAAGVASPDGPFISWRLDMGINAAGTDTIMPNANFNLIDSGFAAFDSSGGLVGVFTLSTDGANGVTVSGMAIIGLGGGDIAGFDLATILMFWDVEPITAIVTTVPIATTAIDFGTDLTGNVTESITINNDTSALADLTNINCTLTGTDAASFSLVPGFPVGSVAAGGSLQVDITGTFAVGDNLTADLDCTFDGDPHTASASWPLLGSGAVPVAIASSTPVSGITINFGIDLNGAVTQSVLIANDAAATADLTNIECTVTGADAASFTLLPAFPAGPVVAGGSLQIDITGTFAEDDDLTADLSCTFDGDINTTSAAWPLLGSAVLANAAIAGSTPAPGVTIDFGNDQAGVSSQSVLITNDAVATADLTNINCTVTGVNAASFSLAPSFPAGPIAAGGSLQIDITGAFAIGDNLSAGLSCTFDGDPVTSSMGFPLLRGTGAAAVSVPSLGMIGLMLLTLLLFASVMVMNRRRQIF